MALDQFRPPDTPYVIFFLTPTLAALDGLCEYIDKAKTDTVWLRFADSERRTRYYVVSFQKTLFEVFFIPEAWYVVREKLKEMNAGKVSLFRYFDDLLQKYVLVIEAFFRIRINWEY